MRIVALGRTRMLWNTIRLLYAAGHSIALIATCKAAPEYDIREQDFEELSNEVGAEFLFTQDLNAPAVVERLSQMRAEVAVSVNWVNLIGPAVCSVFKYGVLNAHAGDLPRYRGNAPVAWAILNGESKIGITIHQMDPNDLDTGPIVLKKYYVLDERTYIGDVFNYLNEQVPQMFLESINGLQSGALVPVPQPADPKLSLRCYPRRASDGWIDWSRPANELARLVRASAEPFSGAFTSFYGERLIVWRAHAAPWPCPSLAVPGQVVHRDRATGQVSVATGADLLVLEEVELVGQQRCAPVMIIKSLRDRLGDPSPAWVRF